ncbi:hypothetical protein LINGRAHAP2_LOCUS30490 [Linum grandiflorum]
MVVWIRFPRFSY